MWQYVLHFLIQFQRFSPNAELATCIVNKRLNVSTTRSPIHCSLGKLMWLTWAHDSLQAVKECNITAHLSLRPCTCQQGIHGSSTHNTFFILYDPLCILSNRWSYHWNEHMTVAIWNLLWIQWELVKFNVLTKQQLTHRASWTHQ